MNTANIITCLRIIFSIFIWFFPPLSTEFYVLYAAAGITDMIDGIVARKTNTVSEFGAKLDSLADLVFVTACLIKLLPILTMPAWLRIWIAVIALIKIMNILFGIVIQKKWVAPHTIMNKITGVLLFILPFTLSFVDLRYSAAILCIVATTAAIQEGCFVITGRLS